MAPSKNEGLLLSKSSKELRQTLRKKGISYFDFEGNIFLNSEGHQILIEKSKNKISHKQKKQISQLTPTNFISPNGLALIDTIFRIDDLDLNKFVSTLQFCKKFDLHQPKVSQLMTKVGAKNLLDFKKKVRAIPIEWWIFALEFRAAKRKMSHFFGASQNYYSLDTSFDKISSSELMSRLPSKFKNEVIAGPIEVAKAMGEIIDDNFSLWVSPSVLTEFKKEFKLIAGTNENRRKWLIAAPPFSLDKEELLSHISKPRFKFQTNLMRAIWDLGFGEARLQEARLNMLRRFLNEA
ncbi:MAG: hypothetical protein ACOYOK_09955 [Pseudobdellovibrionaceae bacterium]